MFCAKKNPAKGLCTALIGKYTNKHVKPIFKSYAVIFFTSVGQGLRGPGHMFEKGDDEREKQTNKTKNQKYLQ